MNNVFLFLHKSQLKRRYVDFLSSYIKAIVVFQSNQYDFMCQCVKQHQNGQGQDLNLDLACESSTSAISASE